MVQSFRLIIAQVDGEFFLSLKAKGGEFIVNILFFVEMKVLKKTPKIE